MNTQFGQRKKRSLVTDEGNYIGEEYSDEEESRGDHDYADDQFDNDDEYADDIDE